MTRPLLLRRRGLLELGSAYVDEVLADAPVLFLLLDDTSGTTARARVGTDGTYVGSPTLAASGPSSAIPRAVTFANDKYATVADAAEYDPGAGPWTIEAWLRAPAASFSTVFTKRLASGDFSQWGFGFGHPFEATSGPRLWALHRQNGSTQRHEQSNAWLDDGRWHHVAVTYDGAGAINLYVDGYVDEMGPFASNTDAGSPNISTTAPVTIASNNAGTEFPGDVAAAAIYPSALSAARISAHFEAGRPEPVAPAAPSSFAGLFLHVAADEIVGLVDGDPVATWSDLSGDGNDLAQATASLQPSYQTAEVNGLPAVRFAGDYLASAAFASAISQPVTIFVVAKLSASSEYLFDGITAGNRMGAYTHAGVNDYEMFQTSALTGSVFGFRSSWQILAFTYNTPTSFLRGRGRVGARGSTGTATTLSGLTLAARYNAAQALNGDIAEVAAISGALTVDEIDSVGRHLAAKYALAWQ